jgi:hypothetical protein
MMTIKIFFGKSLHHRNAIKMTSQSTKPCPEWYSSQNSSPCIFLMVQSFSQKTFFHEISGQLDQLGLWHYYISLIYAYPSPCQMPFADRWSPKFIRVDHWKSIRQLLFKPLKPLFWQTQVCSQQWLKLGRMVLPKLRHLAAVTLEHGHGPIFPRGKSTNSLFIGLFFSSN